jgi:hypothetical protein
MRRKIRYRDDAIAYGKITNINEYQRISKSAIKKCR